MSKRMEDYVFVRMDGGLREALETVARAKGSDVSKELRKAAEAYCNRHGVAVVPPAGDEPT